MQRGPVAEVFAVFLRLGCTSFGGPIAHIGYFRTEFVDRRRWLTDAAFADLVALAQFLPGPASSQAGFAIGLLRAGYGGALAAFVGFTLPSALLMLAFAYGASALSGPLGLGAIAGLKVVAVAVVAQAVAGMARTLCPDRPTAAVAVLAVALIAALPGPVGQIGAIAAGAVAGLARGAPAGVAAVPGAGPVGRGVAVACLTGFAILLFGLPLVAGSDGLAGLFTTFYRAGALVFGGGHVVLPLLEAGVVGPQGMSHAQFLAGYGAAQAVPGPLFTLAAYLGAVLDGPLGALVALCALILPGFLLVIGVLPFWATLAANARARGAMRGANAAVVGVLGAALYDPVFTSGVQDMGSFTLALVLFVALTLWRAPPLAVVGLGVVGGMALAL